MNILQEWMVNFILQSNLSHSLSHTHTNAKIASVTGH